MTYCMAAMLVHIRSGPGTAPSSGESQTATPATPDTVRRPSVSGQGSAKMSSPAMEFAKPVAQGQGEMLGQAELPLAQPVDLTPGHIPFAQPMHGGAMPGQPGPLFAQPIGSMPVGATPGSMSFAQPVGGDSLTPANDHPTGWVDAWTAAVRPAGGGDA